MASGILAGLAAAGSALMTPTGLAAFGVWLGVLDEPLIVIIAPYCDYLATGFGSLSGVSFFYARWRNRRLAVRRQAEPNAAAEDGETS